MTILHLDNITRLHQTIKSELNTDEQNELIDTLISELPKDKLIKLKDRISFILEKFY